MKKQRNLFALMILTLLSTYSLIAQSSTTTRAAFLKVNAIDAQSIDVQLTNLQQKKTILTLKDISGKTWYNKVIKKKYGYAKRMILSEIPAGHYIMTIESTLGHITRIFSKDEKNISVYEPSSVSEKNESYPMLAGTKRAVENRPITRFTTPESKSIGIQLANLLGLPTQVSVISLNGMIKLTDAAKDEYGYAKRFNLNGLSDGRYYIHIQTDQLSQVQFFTIKDNEVTLEDYYLLDPENKLKI